MLHDSITPDPNALHPMEYIEPIEDSHDSRAEVIGKLFGIIFPPNRSGKDNLEAGWLRFICLVMIVKPDLLQGASQTFVAKLAGCTAANVSKYSNEIADKIGMRSGGMKSEFARASYSLAQSRRGKDEEGEERSAVEIHEAAVAKACHMARSKMQTGKAWSRFEKAALFEHGLIDDDEELTTDGIEFFSGGKL